LPQPDSHRDGDVFLAMGASPWSPAYQLPLAA
jgi:hypothetical protein